MLFVAACRLGFDPTTRVMDGSVDVMGDGTQVTCPGYVAWTGLSSTYRVATSPLAWAAAETSCENDETHLVVIDTAAEHAAVRGSAAGTLWIGLSDRVNEGTFLHVTGATHTYSGWPNNPPANTGEDCVDLLANNNWEDEDCTVARAFVCECDGIPAQPTSF